jgi:hypothetical protein
MRMTTKVRLVRVVIGLLSGAAITALFVAILSFTAMYTAHRESMYESTLGWALMAAFSGGAFGYVGGLLLGLFLSLTRRGPIFGALSGGVAGFAMVAASLTIFGGTPKESHEGVMVGGFIPVIVLSGFFISLVLSATTSLTKRTDDDDELLRLEQVLLSLEQNKTNECS